MQFENFDQFYHYINTYKVCGEKINYPHVTEFCSGSFKKINFGHKFSILFKNNEIIKFELNGEINLVVRHCYLYGLVKVINHENNLKFFLISEEIAYGEMPKHYRFHYTNECLYISKITVENGNVTIVDLKLPTMINFPHHNLDEVDKKINLLNTFQ
jgi:hypothetical protein